MAPDRPLALAKKPDVQPLKLESPLLLQHHSPLTMTESPNRLAMIALHVLIWLFLALSFAEGLDLHQTEGMFNPVYRFRQSLAIASTRIIEGSWFNGYLADGAVMVYLRANGMPVLGTEYNGPVPVYPPWLALYKDGRRMDEIISGATKVTLNQDMAPDILHGSEIGVSDYMYFSFVMFGPKMSSMYYFYFLLIGFSTSIFLYSHSRSPPALYALALFMASHYFMVWYAGNEPLLQQVQNNRFFSVPSTIATAHLVIAAMARKPFSLRSAFPAALQTTILMFYFLCRTEVIWHVWLAGLVPVAVSIAPLGAFFRETFTRWRKAGRAAFALVRTRWWLSTRILTGATRESGTAAAALIRNKLWVSAVVLGLFMAVILHLRIAPDHRYREESGVHIIWHEIYTALISAHPKLRELYLDGYEPYGDNVGYHAVLEDLRARNDSTPSIAFIQDGKIYIDIMRNMGEYDSLMKPIVLRVLRNHPREAFEVIFIKMYDQYKIYEKRGVFTPANYPMTFAMAMAAALAYMGTRKHLLPKWCDIKLPACILALALAMSYAPISIATSPYNCGTLILWQMTLLAAITLPLATLIFTIPFYLLAPGRRTDDLG